MQIDVTKKANLPLLQPQPPTGPRKVCKIKHAPQLQNTILQSNKYQVLILPERGLPVLLKYRHLCALISPELSLLIVRRSHRQIYVQFKPVTKCTKPGHCTQVCNQAMPTLTEDTSSNILLSRAKIRAVTWEYYSQEACGV